MKKIYLGTGEKQRGCELLPYNFSSKTKQIKIFTNKTIY